MPDDTNDLHLSDDDGRLIARAVLEHPYFEDWFDACRDVLWAPLNDGRLTITALYHVAFDLGIRLAHIPINQVRINGIKTRRTYAGIPWFEAALAADLKGDFATAAKLFVDHGFNTAFCCQGYQLGQNGFEVSCRLHQAIRQEVCRRN